MNKFISKYKGVIFGFFLITLFACGGKTIEDQTIDDNEGLNEQNSIYKEDKIQAKDPMLVNPTPKALWRNPFMNPFGTSVIRYIRAYYLTGQFEIMRKFLIGIECYSEEELAYRMSLTNWGYKIDATNLKWTSDSVFILTCNTEINSTQGMEEYAGKIINDTAKIFYFAYNEKNPFVYHYEDLEIDNCELANLTKEINFEFNSSKLTSEAKLALKRIYEILNKRKMKIKIEGHTSDEGTEAYNLELSEKRAAAVKEYLVKLGYDNTKIGAKGYGKSRPIYKNKDGQINPKNRRVEIVF